MSAGEIRKEDFGSIFRVTILDQDDAVVSLSSYPILQFWFTKPNSRSVVTKTASVSTDGSDGQMQYVIESGFLDTVGLWRYQGIVASGGSVLYHSDQGQFKVHQNLPE